MNLSVASLFYKGLGLDKLNLDNDDIDYILASSIKYVLGLSKYRTVYKSLHRFRLDYTFSRFLRTIFQEKIDYLLTDYRKDVIKGLSSPDEYWLKKYRVYDQTVQIKEYPSPEDVLISMSKSLKVRISKLKMEPYEKSELFSEFLAKVLDAYRLYIYGYGTVLEERAFYYCLHQSIMTKDADIKRLKRTLKFSILGNRVFSLSNLIEDDNEEAYLEAVYEQFRSLDSPEEVFLAKQEASRKFSGKNIRLQVSEFFL